MQLQVSLPSFPSDEPSEIFEMTLRVAIRAALVSLAVAGTPAAAATAPESRAPSAGRDIHLVYAVHIGGIHTVDLKIDLALGADSYKVELSSEVQGLVRYLLPWSLRVASKGRVAGESLVPQSAHTESSWRGKRRWRTLEYKEGRPVVVSVEPKRKTPPVPPGQLLGSVDVATAILTVARSVPSEKSCAVRVPVYDGRRRFDAVIEAYGEDELPRSSRSAYSGKADVCDLSIEMLHGRRKKTDYGGLASGEKTMTFWFARLFDGVYPLPVRVQLDTDLGGVIGHLTSARMEGAGPSKVYRLPP